MIFRTAFTITLLTLLFHKAAAQETVYLDDLQIDKIEVGWREAVKGKTLEGTPLTLSGKAYERGICTHAKTTALVDLKGKALKFEAVIGLDDKMAGRAFGSTVVFEAIKDGQIIATDTFKATSGGRKVQLDLNSAKNLTLVVSGLDGNTNHSHFVWADARFIMADTTKPVIYQRIHEQPYILTPKPGPKPRINGADVFGVRPNSPLLFKVAATGEKPLKYIATGLPAGVTLDQATGLITGRLASKGTYDLKVTVSNKKGSVTKTITLICGDQIALTPPMGWNSWNCWGMSVTADKIKRTAQAMADKGLIDHGWTYVNIDDGWQGKRGGATFALQPNEKFADMKGLADFIHNLGLKAGLYSTPWVTSYGNMVGGSVDKPDGFRYNAEKGAGRRLGVYPMHQQDAAQFAAWGYDYLKYDWAPIDVPHTEAMGDALKATGRDIVYSLSNSADFKQVTEWKRLANIWRTTGDIIDTWGSLSDIGFSQDRWSAFACPGNWNDPDMLIIGKLGWGDKLHNTRLSPNEQYTHVSLWALLAAPLLLGCDLEQLDDFTLNLITNDEVIAINQDRLGKQAVKVYDADKIQVWKKPLADGSWAIGVFNLSYIDKPVTLDLKAIGLNGNFKVRDCWRQKDLGITSGTLAIKSLPIHGVMLYNLKAAQ